MSKRWQKTALVTFLSVLLVGLAIPSCSPSPPSPSPAPPTRTSVPGSPTTQTTRTHIYIDGKIVVRGSGEPVELINNPNATDPTFAELAAFLERDRTDEYSYIVGPPKNAFVASDFGETVHNNAEAAGIRAAWVAIDIEVKDGKIVRHVLNAFKTRDFGLVYIDCTGKGLWDDIHNRGRGDKRAFVEIGLPYALGKMNSATSHFWFYMSSDPKFTYPEIWDWRKSNYEERKSLSEAWVEWNRTHDGAALRRKWMEEWLQKHEAELSKSGVLGISGTDVKMLNSWEAPWFQPKQVIVKRSEGGDYWHGIGETLLTQYDKVDQEIIEIDGLRIIWEIGWKDLVRPWTSNWFKPYQVWSKNELVSTGAVKNIHVHWGE